LARKELGGVPQPFNREGAGNHPFYPWGGLPFNPLWFLGTPGPWGGPGNLNKGGGHKGLAKKGGIRGNSPFKPKILVPFWGPKGQRGFLLGTPGGVFSRPRGIHQEPGVKRGFNTQGGGLENRVFFVGDNPPRTPRLSGGKKAAPGAQMWGHLARKKGAAERKIRGGGAKNTPRGG